MAEAPVVYLSFPDHYGDRVRICLSNGSLSVQTWMEGDGCDPEWLDLSINSEVSRYEDRRQKMWADLLVQILRLICRIMERADIHRHT